MPTNYLCVCVSELMSEMETSVYTRVVFTNNAFNSIKRDSSIVYRTLQRTVPESYGWLLEKENEDIYVWCLASLCNPVELDNEKDHESWVMITRMSMMVIAVANFAKEKLWKMFLKNYQPSLD